MIGGLGYQASTARDWGEAANLKPKPLIGTNRLVTNQFAECSFSEVSGLLRGSVSFSESHIAIQSLNWSFSVLLVPVRFFGQRRLVRGCIADSTADRAARFRGDQCIAKSQVDVGNA